MERAETLRKLGAEPAVLDLLDREAVRRLVLETEPDAIAHEATALAEGVDFKRFAEGLAPTNRLRTEGTENLLAAAKEAGVERFVAQSYGVMTYARVGGPVKSENDPLDDSLPDAMRATIEAVKHNEAAVLDAGGIALRYGSFYGAAIDPMRDAVQSRKVPIVGDGGGVWSLIHVADAAGATVLALERGASGVIQRRGRRAGTGARGATRHGRRTRCAASTKGSDLAREAVRGRDRRHHHDADPRTLECESQAGARMDAPVSELAARVPGDVPSRAGRIAAACRSAKSHLVRE
jgi:nucleoside-diphosphate-sugar epimerase